MLRRWPIVLGILCLSYLVAVVFYPILGFSFISLDVSPQLLDNPHVHGLTVKNVQHILTSPCIASYYPVRSLTFALDYEIWGLDPTGFKLTGGLIHLTNVVLVFWLVVRLFRHHAASKELAKRKQPLEVGEVALAAFSAGVFAIHPIVVEPVTWVAGREELLMTLGALGCIHFHILARNMALKGGRTRHVTACFVGAAICCSLGCLSSAIGAVIPLLITVWDVLTLPKPKLGAILRGTFALWLIGAATCAVKFLLPSGPQADLPWAILARQPGVILAGYWLNLKTLAWPTKLSLSYVYIRPDDLPVVQVVLGAVAAAATCVLVWYVRRRTRVLFGLLWFFLALAPVSQVLPHHLQRADRYLYLPLVGLAVAAAMALWRVRKLVRGRAGSIASAAVGIGVLFLLVTLSARQVRHWRDDVTLWKHSVAVAPNNPRAHAYLADAYREIGQVDRAFASYRTALRLAPNHVYTLNSFAICLTSDDAPRLHDHLLAVELAERGCLLTEWRDSDLTHTLARSHTSLANTYTSAGQYGMAIDQYHKAIEAHPEYDMAYLNLALVLSTCPDESQRELEEAVLFAERGCRLSDSPNAHRLSILATTYAEVGRFEDAIVVVKEAIEAVRASGNTNELGQLLNYLRLFEDGVPLTASR